MREEISVVQQAYEYVARAGRIVRTREVVAAVGASSVSAVTFALTRLVREGHLERASYGRYRVTPKTETGVDDSRPALDERLKIIFESIRPVLPFEDLVYLYHVVLIARRVAPDLFDHPTESI
jgi:predicted transcriptional regulator of viral defense system